MNLHRFWIRYCLWARRGKFLDFHLVLFGDLIRIFGILRFDAVLLIFGLNSENKSVILFFFLTGSDSSNFFPSSSQILLFCDRAGFVTSGDGFGAWIAEEWARWWRFDWISESFHKNSIDFNSNCFWKRLGFENCSSVFLWFFLNSVNLILTERRENVENVFVMWQNFCGFLSELYSA